jgi:hypothetical protein
MAGLDPAIQHTIEMLRFFLDGRVEHGHDKKSDFGIFIRFPGNDSAESSAAKAAFTQGVKALKRPATCLPDILAREADLTAFKNYVPPLSCRARSPAARLRSTSFTDRIESS